MNLYLRLLLAIVASRLRDGLHHSDVAESRFRVLPHDLDAFGHMNNGRYLQIMDVARTEWMVRTGVFGVIRQQRWAPILGGGFIRFRFSLRLLQAYRVQTRLLCWDHRWFYLEHTFVDRRERCVAVGVTRAGLRADGRWVETGDVARRIDPQAESPAIPGYLREWLDLEDEMYRIGETGRFTRGELRRVS